MKSRYLRSSRDEFYLVRWIRSPLIVAGILWIAGIASLSWASQPALNKIKFDNQSGQNAVVKVVGPTNLVVRVPKQRKKTVHVPAGDYFILVRFGDSEKDYTYTKSDPFAVTQSEGQFSIITFTLFRTKGGDFNTIPASQEEFEEARFPAKGASP